MKKSNLISKRFFSIILTIAVTLSMMLTMAWANADGGVSAQSDAVEMANANEANGAATQATIFPKISYYTDENGDGETLKVDCVHLTSSVTTWDQEWYFANGGTINGDVTIPAEETVNIIIYDGTTLTINGTLKIAGNGSESANLKIYGTSQAGTGKMVVTNLNSSQNNGNAIMSENEKTAYIHLIGGELTATGSGYNAEEGTGAALSNVRLLSEVNETIHRTAEVKCIVTGSDPEQKVEDTQTETSVTISRCECAEKDWKYEQGENNTHRGYCNLCGYVENWDNGKNGYVGCSFGGGASVSAGEAGHYCTCYCGRRAAEPTPHEFVATPTDDGSGHTKRCMYCGYTPEGSTVEAHVYDDNGECKVCGFRIAAKDSSGKFYGSVNDALESVNDGGTVTLETHDTSENKEISEAVEFNRAGAAVTLKMNGYTLTNTRGNSTITVENGALTIADDATITQNGGSQEAVKSAIRVTGGTLTFEKNVTAQGGACSNAQSPAIEVTGGSLVFKGDLIATGGYYNDNANAARQAAAVFAEGGMLDFQKSLDLSGGLTITKSASLANGLTQGVFWSKAASAPDGNQVKRLSVEGAKNHQYLHELLADGYAFVDKDDSTLFRCVQSFESWSGDVTIVEHTHTWGSADSGDIYECTACKKSCAHGGGYKTGKCEVCGKPCPHEIADQSPVDHNYYCNECGVQAVARFQRDEYNYLNFTTLVDAMNAATDGKTILLLADIDNDNKTAYVLGDGKTVTLDLNGHTITGGWILVGKDRGYPNQTITSSTLKIVGSGSFASGYINIGKKATLDLSGWTGGTITTVSMDKIDNDEGALIVGKDAGAIGNLQFFSWPTGDKYMNYINNTKLSGGSYDRIDITMKSATGASKAIPYSSMLETGYAFRYIESGNFVDYNTKAEYGNRGDSISNVRVVKCPHEGEPTDQNKCKYCDTALVAKVTSGETVTGYESFETAINAAKTGDTVTLLASDSTSEYTIDRAITIDLNGKSIKKLTCTAKGTKIMENSEETHGTITSLEVSSDGFAIKDLLLEGYGFKVSENGTTAWATEEQLNGNTLANAFIMEIPFGVLRYDRTKSVDYGAEASLSVTPEKVVEGKPVSYMWYKLQNNILEEITGETGSTYNLPIMNVGDYIYRFKAICDDYTYLSEDITVTVNKVAPTYTAPTAKTNLSYTGLAQDLVEAGSTEHGRIEYSLEENGTYSTDIPTGTNAGTYTVWYKVVGDNNHNDVAPQRLTVEIAKCKISISGFEIAPKTYKNGDNTATVTQVTFANLQNGEIFVRDADFAAAAKFENANAGTRSAILTVTLSDGAKAENYELEKNTLAKEFTIEQAEAPVLSNVSESVTYGDNAQKTVSVANAGLPTDAGTLTYKAGSTSVTNVDWSVDTDGTVKYTVSGANAETVITLPIVISSTNYKDTTVNVVITITKAAPSLEITNKAALNRTYDGTSVAAEHTTNSDGAVTVEYYEGNSKLEAAPTDAGTYKVIVKLALGTNYEAAQAEAEFTIAKRSIEGAAISLGDELTYTGEEQTQEVKSVTVKLDEATSLEATYDVSENTGTNAETYTLTVTGIGNFEGTATKAFEIKQAEVTLTDAADNTPVQNAIYKDTEVAKATFKNKKATVNFNGQEVELEGVWTLTETSEGEKFESTGEFDREAVFTPADANFAPIKQTVKIKVTTRSSGAALLPTTEVKTDDKTSQTGEKEKVTTSPSEVKNETTTDASGNQVTTAKVTVSAANQKEILKQAKENKSGEIIIKVSEKDVKDGAKLELNLDKSFIEDILNNTDADLTIQTPDGEKTFTQEELKTLVESASGNTITLDPAATSDPANPSEPTNPDGTLTPAQQRLVKGVQNTTIALKSKLTKKGKIRLTWTKSKGYKLDRFEIYRSVKKNSGYGKKAFFTTKNGKTVKYLNTKSLKKGKTYYYKLRGVRIIGGKKYYTQWSNKTWRTVK